MQAAPTARTGPLLVDAHVHLHPSFDAGEFFAAARLNFAAAAVEAGLQADSPGCLILTEGEDHGAFAGLASGRHVVPGWSVQPTREPISLWARTPAGGEILLLSGRQIPTADGIEVLALCTDRDFASGKTLGDTLAAVADSGAVPVIPWGFGKWWFRRGRLLEELLTGRGTDPLFLGDQGGRPALTPPSRLFAIGGERRAWTLPGSDPLPFTEHQKRAGSYGFVLPGPIDRETPGASIRTLLLQLEEQPRRFGQGRPPAPFVRDQVRMQMHKRGLGR